MFQLDPSLVGRVRAAETVFLLLRWVGVRRGGKEEEGKHILPKLVSSQEKGGKEEEEGHKSLALPPLSPPLSPPPPMLSQFSSFLLNFMVWIGAGFTKMPSMKVKILPIWHGVLPISKNMFRKHGESRAWL